MNIHPIKPYFLLVTAISAVFWVCGGILTHTENLCQKVPYWVTLQEKQGSASFCNGTESETVTYCLRNGSLSILDSARQKLYQSDDDWLVVDCFFCDIDYNHAEDVILHVWKGGSFGQYQPFWKEQDDKAAYSEHIFIYDWNLSRTDRLKPKWMSSAMPVSGESISIDKNGVFCITAPDGSCTFWKWEGWGLALDENKKIMEELV